MNFNEEWISEQSEAQAIGPVFTLLSFFAVDFGDEEEPSTFGKIKGYVFVSQSLKLLVQYNLDKYHITILLLIITIWISLSGPS